MAISIQIIPVFDKPLLSLVNSYVGWYKENANYIYAKRSTYVKDLLGTGDKLGMKFQHKVQEVHKGLAQTYWQCLKEQKNIDLIKVINATIDRLLGRSPGFSNNLITYVIDRTGHDLRYAIDSYKLKNELGW